MSQPKLTWTQGDYKDRWDADAGALQLEVLRVRASVYEYRSRLVPKDGDPLLIALGFADLVDLTDAMAICEDATRATMKAICGDLL